MRTRRFSLADLSDCSLASIVLELLQAMPESVRVPLDAAGIQLSIVSGSGYSRERNYKRKRQKGICGKKTVTAECAKRTVLSLLTISKGKIIVLIHTNDSGAASNR